MKNNVITHSKLILGREMAFLEFRCCCCSSLFCVLTGVTGGTRTQEVFQIYKKNKTKTNKQARVYIKSLTLLLKVERALAQREYKISNNVSKQKLFRTRMGFPLLRGRYGACFGSFRFSLTIHLTSRMSKSGS